MLLRNSKIRSNIHIRTINRHPPQQILSTLPLIMPFDASSSNRNRICRAYNYRSFSIIDNSPIIIKQKTFFKRITQKMKMYADLAKYKLSALVVVTSGAGFICSGNLDETIATACIGTALCAAAAGTFNQIIEKDRDILMLRTRLRPLPSNRISSAEAFSFGVLSTLSGVSILASINPTCATLGLFNIFLYAGPYTISKQYTELNTWIGSIVGAIPPLIGWAAASGGSLLHPDPIALALILYWWQFPHFFALSWLHREDYTRGAFQMVAVNDPSGARSANLILKYSVYLSTIPFITSAFGITSYMFVVEGCMLNAYLIFLSNRFYNEHNNNNARRVFLATLWYLPLLLAGFVLHNHNWDKIDNNIRNSQMADYFIRVKEQMKDLCLHEIFIYKNKDESLMRGGGGMCPKIIVDSTEATAPIKATLADAESSSRDDNAVAIGRSDVADGK